MSRSLTPRELAAAVGLSESSLKRWADDGLVRVTRTAGGHRRIAVPEAVRFIRAMGLPVVDPRPLGITMPSRARRVSEGEALGGGSAAAWLQTALSEGDAEAARGMIVAMYLDGHEPHDICDGPVARALREIGELWKHGEEGIFIEHRATDLCLQAMSELRRLIPEPPEGAPIAVGGAPPGDPYILPSMMVATVLAAEGWRPINLGPETPDHVLLSAARVNHAVLLWRCLSVAEHERTSGAELASLADHVRLEGAHVVAGGRGCPSRVMPHRDNLMLASSMGELAAFARGLRAAHRPVEGGGA